MVKVGADHAQTESRETKECRSQGLAEQSYSIGDCSIERVTFLDEAIVHGNTRIGRE